MKKLVLFILIACISIGQNSFAFAEDVGAVMQQFKAAQTKLRDLRQSGASASEIAAQEAKVRSLRAKASSLQSEIGQ